MPAERFESTRRNAGSAGRLSEEVDSELASRRCAECGKILSRTADVGRHAKIHNGVKKLPCPWNGCDFSTLQKSNLDTHVRRHTGDKPFVCTDDSDPKCKFQTCDPASLIKHRKNLHNYIPRARAKTVKSSMASTDSSSSRSPLPVDSFLKSFSPVPTLPLPNTNSPGFSSRLSPFGESGTTGITSSSPNTYSLNNSESNNYASAWDTSEINFLADPYYYIEANNSWLRTVYDDL